MRLPTLLTGFIILTAASCKQDKEIKVYRLAKEADAPPAAAADPHAGMPGMMPGAQMPERMTGDPHAGMTAEQLAAASSLGGDASVSDSAPDGWTKQPTSAMRQLSYLVKGDDGAGADVSLIILRGAAGSDLDNVNRWRGQLGLQPVDDSAFRQSAQTLSTPLGAALSVDLEGLPDGGDAKNDGRILGAIIHRGEETWFFKMRGNADLTAAQKSAFLAWAQSVQPADPAVMPAPSTPQTLPPAAPAGDGSVIWQLPDGWAAGDGSSARYATITITGADGSKGELAVTHFPGDVGGDLANVNRWRGQTGLGPIDEAALAPLIREVTAGPKTLKVVDLTGPQSRTAAAWILHGGETWFFKFTGPDALVGAEMTKFNTYLKSIRFTTPD